jgi:hypothetical protein
MHPRFPIYLDRLNTLVITNSGDDVLIFDYHF